MPRCHVALLWALLFTLFSVDASARLPQPDDSPSRFGAGLHASVAGFPSGPAPGIRADDGIGLSSEGTPREPGVAPRQPAIVAGESSASSPWLAIHCGFLIALGAYNVLLYFALRDRAYLAYTAYVLATLVGQVSLAGVAGAYLWPDAPRRGDAAVASSFALAGCMGAIFTRVFLRTALAVPVVDKVAMAFVAGLAFAALAPLCLPARLAVLLTSTLGIAFALVAALAGWLCWQRKVAGARGFLLGWLTLLAGVVVHVLRPADIAPGHVLVTEAMPFSSSLGMLLLSFALADRLLVADRERKLAQADALAAKEQLVRSMGESERRLESRVLERTRDLACANRELERARLKLEQLVHYDQLTQLPNRLMLKARLDLSVARACGRRSTFAVLWVDLDGFKEINDLHGHLLGDEVLRVLSGRMLESCPPPDLIVRFGGDEFIAVLDRSETIAQAGAAAQRLIDAIHREVRIDGRRLALQASVGISLYPGHGADGQTLLARADRAMYAAKAAGGSCWREASDSDALLRA